MKEQAFWIVTDHTTWFSCLHILRNRKFEVNSDYWQKSCIDCPDDLRIMLRGKAVSSQWVLNVMVDFRLQSRKCKNNATGRVGVKSKSIEDWGCCNLLVSSQEACTVCFRNEIDAGKILFLRFLVKFWFRKAAHLKSLMCRRIGLITVSFSNEEQLIISCGILFFKLTTRIKAQSK